MEIQYWHNGEPVLEDTSSSMKELKYWLNGEPYTVIDAAAAAGTNMEINIGDDWKDISGLEINIGDTWKTVTKVQLNVGDTWKTIFEP